VRAKDKELGAAQGKLEWAKGVEMANKGLTNDLAAAGKALADAQAEIKTLLQVGGGGGGGGGAEPLGR
jgi:hypothetical protein